MSDRVRSRVERDGQCVQEDAVDQVMQAQDVLTPTREPPGSMEVHVSIEGRVNLSV